ncbi:major facilitator superfamily domain-containing protein 8 isoform X3 [Zootermopsis nevadensis]|nr:major facilitator superfamily domain-containing protein 8 isoform X3 [Zootermopsis nevadensis]XP_021935964.1 major facilitator superfamily domain-containing protein 8 isoform X3 [Zootermopsis nevadensis]
MFLMSLGFSIILTGVWPYLDKLDPTAGKEFMGYIVGANPFGQMIFSPLVGWWGNRLGSIRLPLMLSLTVFTLSSTCYSMLEIFPWYRKYWMLGARFFVGVSSASIAVCRSYLSAATKIKERTAAVSMVSLAQVLGFVVGPGLQAVVTPLGDKGISLIPGVVTLDMYTAAGWINVLLGVFNCLLFLPYFFQERRIAAREAMLHHGMESEEETWKQAHPDYISSWTLICAFFVLVFNFVLLETLGTSLTMDQFAWTKAEALYYMGILMSVGAVVACITFVAIGPLCKRFPERKVLMWGGFFFMVVGRALYIPWGNEPPIIAEEIAVAQLNETYGYVNTAVNETEIVGCPSVQKWCYYIPAMTIAQFLLGYAFTAVGYPIAVTLIQTIFSKILGPRPQGVWMGLMTGAGCLSRVMGPVFVSFVYTRYGTIWTFGITTAMMIASMVWLQLVEKRLVAPDLPPVSQTHVELQVLSSEVINGKPSLEEYKPLQKKSDSNCT